MLLAQRLGRWHVRGCIGRFKRYFPIPYSMVASVVIGLLVWDLVRGTGRGLALTRALVFRGLISNLQPVGTPRARQSFLSI